MQYDHRQNPSAPSPIEPTGFFTGIQIRPILVGVVVDVVASLVLSAAYYAHFVEPGAGMAGAFSEEAAKFWSSSEGLVATLVLGSLGTAVGGFYAAYKAGTLEMKHGALVGIGSIILGLAMQSGSEENMFPEWFTALAAAAAIPAGALGGFCAEIFKNATSRTTRHRANPPRM
jgi:putative membrane protein (TIGR04086 family)